MLEISVSLPLDLAGVTADWLTRALAGRYPGLVVDAAQVTHVQPGTATKVGLRLEYNAAGRAAGLPQRLLLKAGLGGPEQLAIVGSAFACEVKFYSDWAPHLDINIPACYFAQTDASNGQSVLLLEDLGMRGVQFGHAPLAMSVGAVARVLGLLAQCHARWWNSGSLASLDAYPGILGGITDRFFAPEHFAQHLELPRGRFVPRGLRDCQVVEDAMRAMWRFASGHHQCLIHGDPHMGNLYFERDGAPGILDWQSIMRGPWAHDVAYFIVSALSVTDRRQHEQDLLRTYLQGLAEHGGPRLSFDEGWLRYRRHALHGFFWVLTPHQMQPEEICEVQSERVCAAIIDLESLAALPR